jgi:DNA-binding HxlR family transcriptional regulator
MNGTLRYKELMTAIPDISQKMLSSKLKRLEEDQLLTRKMYAEIPPKVEYTLTEMGKELIPSVQLMINWAQTHFEVITK